MEFKSVRRTKRIKHPEGGFIDMEVFYCFLCNVECQSTPEFRSHLATDHHAFRWCLDKFEKKRDSLIKERHGICIEVVSENKIEYQRFKGKVFINVQPFQPSKLTLEVVNLRHGVGGDGGGGPEKQKKRYGLGGGGKRGQVIIHKIVSLVEGPRVRDSLGVCEGKNTVEIAQDNLYPVSVEIHGMDVSSYHFPVLFVFQLKATGCLFYIIRELVLNVTSGEKLVQPITTENSPFKGWEWTLIEGTFEAIRENGVPVRKISDYPIPFKLIPVFESNLKRNEQMLPECEEALDLLMTLIQNGVSRDNYQDYYHILLFYQEYGEQVMIEKFNMTGVTLAYAAGGLLELQVPGLEEKRPSVLEEDLVYFRLRYGDTPAEVDSVEYETRVHKVKQGSILVSAGNGLNGLVFPDTRFDVRFGLNRFPLLIMHRAVDGIVEQELLDYVFPDEEMAVRTNDAAVPHLKFFNKKIEENPEQKQAVINIILGSSMPAPYIVFGPPGTGKTITIVEAILQVLVVCEDSNILVCAPSNAACDLLAEMLLPNCDSKDILRLHSRSRDIKSIPPALYKCSNIRDDEIYMPDNLVKYRILCCTLISAGKISMNRIPRDHFTHLFIDECGQAVEPEAVAGISGIMGFRAANMGPRKGKKKRKSKAKSGESNLKGLVVLAGDPLQLGPVCPGEDVGLGISLLERLMTKCSLYQRQGEFFNPKFITKLVRNFRSHPDILLLPNQLFYENELEAHSEAVLKDPLCISSFPVFFHSVVGGDEREGSSPSYFNMKEVEVVIGYLSSMLSKKAKLVIEKSEIGVLTPYTRQVYKLKQALARKGWEDVEVGSTEVYQGREKRVMIISTVRSAETSLLVDGKYRLGFLINPKRFNVAITRAQARLIVIGDPYTLSRNPNWMAVIELAMKHSTYFGARFIPRDNTFTSRLHPILNEVAHAKNS